MGLPSFSIKRPVFTTIVFAAVIVIGIISLMRLKVELYQGQSQSIISIVVRARGGLPSQDVEKMITKPIEEAVGTVSHMKSLYSSSREAESRVTMEFEPGTNMKFASLEIREKFARVRPLLPKEIEKPVIANYDDAQAAIMVFAVTSEVMTPEQIREMVDIKLKPILSRVDGVASVEVYGGRERKILVELDRDKMVAYNISIERVMDVLGQSNINLLAGNVEIGKYEFAIRSMGAFLTVADVGDIGVKATRQGSIIPLKEIATIKDSYLEATDQARLNLEQNVTVYVKKASLANTLEVADNLNKVLDNFEAEHKENLKIVMVNDRAETIRRAIGDVKDALLIGFLLTIAVIYFYLRRWILALIITIIIPCSLVGTFIFMAAFGISINVMTLSGLALATGILVDTAIVIMENIFSKKEKGLNDTQAVRGGSEEVWLPLLASLVTTLVVFLPIVFIDKTIQLTYGGFAFTITVSLIISFFSALMLIPMLIRQFALGQLHQGTARQVAGESFFATTKNRYRKALRRIFDIRKAMLGGFFFAGFLLAIYFVARLKFSYNIPLFFFVGGGALAALAFSVIFKVRRIVVAGVVAAAFFFAIYFLSNTPMDWPSTFEENEFAIITFPLAGARLESNDEAMAKIEELLTKIPDVSLFSTTVSKDDLRLFVRLKPERKRQFSKEEIMKIIDEQGNAAIKEIHSDYSLIVDEGAGSSETRKLVLNIYGQDGDTLEKLAKEFANRMSKVEGLSNLVMTDLRKRPEYSLVADKGKAAMFGLNVKSIADSMHAQVRGMRPTKFHELSKGEEIETITRLQAIYRQKLEDLGQIYVETRENRQIPVSEIANFYPSTGPQTIDRKEKHRYVFVKGDVKRPIELVAQDVKAALADVKLPDDYYWRFGGGFDELMMSKGELGVAVVLTILLVYMVMACLYQSYLYPLLIMLTVPMAAIGIWFALAGGPLGIFEQIFGELGKIPVVGVVFSYLTHLLQMGQGFFQKIPILGAFFHMRPLSTQVFIGMILLVGYVVNAAIILLDHMLHLDPSLPMEDRLIEAGQDRLRPILMTTSSTVLGFMPMAMGFGQASELWSPLAITIIGGLISSTILILFVLPAFVMAVDDFGRVSRNFRTAVAEKITVLFAKKGLQSP